MKKMITKKWKGLLSIVMVVAMVLALVPNILVDAAEAPAYDETQHRLNYAQDYMYLENGGKSLGLELANTDTYYVSFNVQSVNTFYFDIRTGLKMVLTNGLCRIDEGETIGSGAMTKSMETNLINGAEILICSEPDKVSVWVNGTLAIDHAAVTVQKREAKPKVNYGKEATVSSIKVWKAPVYENAEMLIESGAKELGVTFDKEQTYSIEFNVTSANTFYFDIRTGVKMVLTNGLCRIDEGSNIGSGAKQKTMATNLSSGTDIVIKSTPDKVSVWINGTLAIDNAVLLDNTNREAKPKVNYAKAATLKNLRIYEATVCEIDELYLEANGTTLDPKLEMTDTYYIGFKVKSENTFYFDVRTGIKMVLTNGLCRIDEGTNIGSGEKQKTMATNLSSGADIVIKSAPDKVSVWINGTQAIDNAVLLSDTNCEARPKVNYGKAATVYGLKIWTVKTGTEGPISDEPVYNAENHTLLDASTVIGGGTNGSQVTYSDGTLSVPCEANAYFDLQLASDADYYATMTVKTAGTVTIQYKESGKGDTNNGYVYFNKLSYKSYGTGGDWETKSFATLASGMRVTIHSTNNQLQVWADGEKLIDAAYTAGGSNKLGVRHSYGNDVTITGVQVWKDKGPEPTPTDEPVYDAQTGTKYEIVHVSGGTYENGVLSIPAEGKANMITDLPYNASYYATMTVKSAGALNLAYRDGSKDFFQIAQNGYYSMGTGGKWINKAFPYLATGTRVTFYSSPSEFKIWVDGEKILEDTYQNGGTALPGITWAKIQTDVTDICIWTEENAISDLPVYDANKHEMHEVSNIGAGVVEPQESFYFVTDLDASETFYMSMTVQTEGAVNINYRYPNGVFQMNKTGYNSVGTSSGWVNKPFAKLAYGVNVTIYSASDWITVWINGQKVVDEAYLAAGEGKPGISWSFNNPVTVSDVRLWTDFQKNDNRLGEIGVTASDKLSGTKEYGVTLDSTTNVQNYVDTQPVGKNVLKETTKMQDAVTELVAAEVTEEKTTIADFLKAMIPIEMAVVLVGLALLQLLSIKKKKRQ